MSADRDGLLLERAGFEAERAEWLFTAPNPRVGALAFRGGHRVGEGAHRVWGGPHAEEAALRAAGAWDQAAVAPRAGVVDEMVVSLEPCTSSGGDKKRPACAELLLQAGVRRVVVGALDPDPRHHGRGVAMLQAAGVEVLVRQDPGGSFARVNAAFLRGQAHPERPWVLLKWAASVDGKTAAQGGVSQWISGSASRAEVHRLRASTDAVLAGPGTLSADDPELTARPEGEPLARQPLRVLFDPRAQLPAGARARRASGARLLVCRDDVPAPTANAEEAVLRLSPDAAGRLDLVALLRHLRRGHGVRRLLVEGGARLHGALFDAGLVDAIVRYEAPLLLGGGLGAVLGGGAAAPASAPRLGHEERADLGADLRRAFQLLAPEAEA